MLSILVAFIIMFAEGAKQGNQAKGGNKQQNKPPAKRGRDLTQSAAKPATTTQVVAVDRFRGRTTVVTVPAKPASAPAVKPAPAQPAVKPANAPAPKPATKPKTGKESLQAIDRKVAFDAITKIALGAGIAAGAGAFVVGGVAFRNYLQAQRVAQLASRTTGIALTVTRVPSAPSLVGTGSPRPSIRGDWLTPPSSAPGSPVSSGGSFSSQSSFSSGASQPSSPASSVGSNAAPNWAPNQPVPAPQAGPVQVFPASSSGGSVPGSPIASSGWSSSVPSSPFGSSSSISSFGAAGAGGLAFVGKKPAGASVKVAPAKPADLSQAQATYARTAISRSGLSASQPTTAQIQAAAKQGYQYVGNGMFAKFYGQSTYGMTLAKSNAFKVAGTPTATQRGLAPQSRPASPKDVAIAKAIQKVATAKTLNEKLAAASQLAALRRSGNPTIPRAT